MSQTETVYYNRYYCLVEVLMAAGSRNSREVKPLHLNLQFLSHLIQQKAGDMMERQKHGS